VASIIQDKVMEVRAECVDPKTNKPLPGKSEEIDQCRKELKCFIHPRPWYMNPAWEKPLEIWSMLPNDELHSFSLGLIEHLMKAIAYL
jgi:hypothetical protein